MVIFKKAFHCYQNINNKINARVIRRRLKNHNFTLITSTCIGGAIYSLLGEKFNSPTINLWISQPDFCEFCSKLKYYLSLDLEFIDDSTRDCPVAKLGEITIVFVHYHSEDEAKNKWNERKQRVNWDNLYIITSDGNGATEEDFKKLDSVNCKRKIIFTSRKRPEIKDSYYLKSMAGEPSAATHMLKRNKLTRRRTWEHEFDYVKWLNDESFE